MKISSILSFFAAIIALCAAGVPRSQAQGPVDGFNPNANGVVNAVLVQADGKVVIAGNFTSVRGQPRARIARLLADGTLDLAFNPGADRSVNCLALQADGKVVVGGDFLYVGGQLHPSIARLNANGSMDSSFKGTADGGVQSVAIAADGRFVLGGAFFKLNGVPRSFLGRLTTTGALDAAFNPVVDGAVSSIAIQPGSGGIIIGGAFYNLGGISSYHLGRVLVTGAVDASFNPGVEATGVTVAKVNSISLQPDGRILVGGVFAKLAGQARANIGRLLASGALDPTFNPSTDGPVEAVALQPADEKILIGGKFSNVSGYLRTNFCRLSGSGLVDSGYNPRADAQVNAFAVQPDRSIIVGGEFGVLGGQSRNFVGRLLPVYASGTNTALTSLGLDVPTLDPQTGALTPVFSASGTSYSVSTTRHTLGVKPVSADAGATVFARVNGGAFSRVISGSSSLAFALGVGRSVIEVKVVADDGITANSYSIAVTRSLSADASLAGLSLEEGALHPTFVTSGTRYSVELVMPLDEASGATVRIIPVRSNSYATVTMSPNGGAFQLVTGTSNPVVLRNGVNTIDVQVTSENGLVRKLYRLLTDSIPASPDANLASLTVSQGTLTPEFASSGTGYSILVSGSALTVKPVTENANATISVSLNSQAEQTIISGRTSPFLALDPGSNTVAIEVMAETGVDTQTYLISVTRVDVPIGRAPDLITPGSVTLGSIVDPLVAASGTAVFEYGVTKSYGNSVVASISGASPAVASATLSGLDRPFAYQVWHYRIALEIGADVYYGPDQTFVTSWPSTSPIVVNGDDVPAMTGVKFQTFGTPATNSNGDLAFQSMVGGSGVSGSNRSLLWFESNPAGHQIVRQGDSIPGVPGATFAGFGDPVLNKVGTVAFMGVMNAGSGGVTTLDAKGIWTMLSGSLQMVARLQHSWQVPDAPGANFGSFHNLVLPETGGPIFLASLVPGVGGVVLGNSQGVWGLDSGNRLREIVRTGDMVDAQGRLQRVLLGPLPTPPAGSSVWVERATTHGAWQALVFKDSEQHTAIPPWQIILGPLPKIPLGSYQWIVRDPFGVVRPFIRRGDQIDSSKITALSVFSGTPDTAGQNRSHNAVRDVALSVTFADRKQGILRIAPNLSGSLLVSAASSVPQIAGAKFEAFYGPAISDAGYLAFRARFSGPGITQINDTAIFAGRGASWPMARTGSAAPGITGAVFASLDDPVYNSHGEIAFRGTVRGGVGVTAVNAAGLWASGSNGKLRLIARTNQGVVPGYPAAARFSLIRQFVLPDKGGVIFLADINGVALTDNQGLWVADAAGQPRLIVRKGGGLMVDGVAKQIIALSILTGTPETLGQKRAFADGSELVYKASFSDGTQGIFQVVIN